MGLFDELKKSIFGEATNPPSPRQQRNAPRIQKQSGPYEVILIGDGGNKVQSIKAVRAVIPSFGLKEAKEFVESTPSTLLSGVSKEEAFEARQILAQAGAKVDITQNNQTAASSNTPDSPDNSPQKKKTYQPPSSDKTIVIEYLNYAGDLKQFIGDPKSIRRKGNHFSVRVAPTFKRISLNRSKTRILKGVAAPAQLPKEPLPVQTTTSDTSIIHYTNWQGVQKEFKIISGVVDDKGDFVRVRVSPTFQYITLKRTRIGNPEALFEKTPGQEPATPHEPQPVAEEPAPNTSGQVSLIITSCGLGTYDATKIIQEIRPELGTFDTYQLMRDFPNTIADNLEPDAAAQFKKRLEDAGCTVEIK